ncbi:mitoguardin 1-like [Coregonus clupeaformis]|uniref:mitoguardin 1-like n=1 Tax=Coregonus clupeaformis TaxID=59861 RepID=UPI001E1C6DDD|nr:mitoguardin 1-like [Coregonus clupeaformis]
MEALTSSDSTSLNYLTHAGRMVLSGLSELNQQDVRQFQQAYDLLVNFINEPANREQLEQEMALVGIDRINFADVFYEFVLLILLEGKTFLPISVKAW